MDVVPKSTPTQNSGPMLDQRRRRWSSIGPVFGPVGYWCEHQRLKSRLTATYKMADKSRQPPVRLTRLLAGEH